jgi:UPF0271 protein
MNIDLNADLGEGFGPYSMGDDAALIPLLSSANVACGFHAGDPMIMRQTVRCMKQHKIDLGAHVGFEDKLGFGRNRIQMKTSDLEAMVIYQLGALDAFAKTEQHALTHMSFHGALGNMVAEDAQLAHRLVGAVAAFNDQMIISSSSSEAIENAAATHSLRVETTFLADRAYLPNGLLVPRTRPNSVITDDHEVLERIERLLNDQTVVCYDGEVIPMPARSILLHGDTPGAVHLAQTVRDFIEQSGSRIVPVSQL